MRPARAVQRARGCQTRGELRPQARSRLVRSTSLQVFPDRAFLSGSDDGFSKLAATAAENAGIDTCCYSRFPGLAARARNDFTCSSMSLNLMRTTVRGND